MDKVKSYEYFINEREIPDKQGEIIIIMGPPGSGKGTVSKKLASKNGFTHISTGELIRNSKDEDLKKIIAKGDYIPDRIMARMLRRELGKADLESGVVIDGFPRTIKQTKMLDSILGKLGVGLNHCIYLDLSRKKSRERILNRAEKEGREDDKNPDVINKRFDEYENKTKPLLDKYRKSRKLVKINASPGSEEVYKQVIDKIGIKPTSLEKEKS
jgi:adenylate kinase